MGRSGSNRKDEGQLLPTTNFQVDETGFYIHETDTTASWRHFVSLAGLGASVTLGGDLRTVLDDWLC